MLDIIIRELQMKTTRYLLNFTPVKMVKTQTTASHACEDVEQKEVIYCWWECKMVQPFQKTVWQSLRKLNTLLDCNPPFLLLVIYVNRLKIYIYTKIRTWVLIAVLL